MYPRPIGEYHRPASLHEALQLAGSGRGGAIYIAGGMSLMQALKSRVAEAERLIDLNHIAELRGIAEEDGGLTIGAMTRHRDLAAQAGRLGAYEAIADAAAHVGDRQVRNRGTIGGSLSWNYVAACLPTVALGCGAVVRSVGTSGERVETPIDAFQKGALTTALEEGEIVTAIHFPRAPAGAGSAYRKWGIVHDALPVIGVCVHVQTADGRITGGRFAVTGLADGPARSARAEAQMAQGFAATDAAAISACAAAAAEELSPPGDAWVSADYKKELIAQLGREMLALAAARATGG